MLNAALQPQIIIIIIPIWPRDHPREGEGEPPKVTNVSTEGDCSVVGDDDGLVCYMH